MVVFIAIQPYTTAFIDNLTSLLTCLQRMPLFELLEEIVKCNQNYYHVIAIFLCS